MTPDHIISLWTVSQTDGDDGFYHDGGDGVYVRSEQSVWDDVRMLDAHSELRQSAITIVGEDWRPKVLVAVDLFAPAEDWPVVNSRGEQLYKVNCRPQMSMTDVVCNDKYKSSDLTRDAFRLFAECPHVRFFCVTEHPEEVPKRWPPLIGKAHQSDPSEHRRPNVFIGIRLGKCSCRSDGHHGVDATGCPQHALTGLHEMRRRFEQLESVRDFCAGLFVWDGEKIKMLQGVTG